MDLRQVTKFAAVGFVNTTVDVSLFAVLVTLLDWHIVPANIVSYGAGIANSFLMNKFWTFRDRTPLSHSAQPLLRFFLFSVSSLALSTGVIAVASLVLSPMIAKLLSVGVVFGWNYLTSRAWVFGPAAP